jgi:hypothetical protein
LKTEEKLKTAELDRARKMYEVYDSGASQREVGSKFGISGERVRQIFKKAGFKIRRHTESAKLLEARKKSREILIPREILEKIYVQEKRGVNFIIKTLKVGYPKICRSLDAYGIERRTNDEANLLQVKNPELDEALLTELYHVEKLSADEIALRFGCAPITVRKRLRKFGIKKIYPKRA